jgi:hypothetical protein
MKGFLIANQSSVFDKTGNNRAEYGLIYCAEKNVAYFEFQAASMKGDCHFKGNRGAWVSIQLVDRNGKVFGPPKQAAAASVGEPGGYQSHKVDVSSIIPVHLLKLAKSFHMLMLGSAASCP